MGILDTLIGGAGGDSVNKLGQQFGLKPDQVSSVLKQLVPALNSGVKKNTQASGGIESLLGALTKGNHERFLDDPELLTKEESVQEGNGILGHIFGSKDVSRQVASQTASKTGVDADVIKKMLPLVANMVMGSMKKETQQLGAKIDEVRQQSSGNPLASFLDADGDGSIADDLFGMAKKLF